MIEIIFDIECADKDTKEKMIRRAAECVLTHEGRNSSASITIVDKDEIQRINREFRNIDKVTDVLSFPAWDGSEYDVTDGYLGDIAICLERAQEQAEEYGHSLERELSFLTIHGMLHICGYDHIEPEDEKVMFGLQNELLNKMGVTR